MTTPNSGPTPGAGPRSRTGPRTGRSARPGHASCSCDEYVGLRTSRRSLLQGAALAGTSLTIGSAVVSMAPAASAATESAPWVLVVLSLRGAADGMSLVVPHGDPAYYTARPTIAVPKSQLLQADSMFGLHPALSPLEPLWTSNRLAAVHATGLPVANRSHFAAMEEVEDAAPGSRARSGWLNRLLGTDGYTSPLQGLGIGSVPTSMVGAAPVMAASDVDSVRVTGADSLTPDDPRMAALTRAWGSAPSTMGAGMRAALDAVADFQPVRDVPDTSDLYGYDDISRALATVARTIKGDVGSAVFTVDQGDWDMHTDVGSPDGGWLHDNASDLAGAIATFFTDLGDLGAKVTLVTISEFGRRTVENSAGGLDHGWGNVMLLAGAGVKGGQYHGTWPGLTVTGDADLAVTTDYRSVLAEVIAARTSASTATVFPGFTRERVGVMTGQ